MQRVKVSIFHSVSSTWHVICISVETEITECQTSAYPARDRATNGSEQREASALSAPGLIGPSSNFAPPFAVAKYQQLTLYKALFRRLPQSVAASNFTGRCSAQRKLVWSSGNIVTTALTGVQRVQMLSEGACPCAIANPPHPLRTVTAKF